MKKIINYLNDAIKEDKKMIIFTIIIFIIGLIAGSLFINFISNNDKKILIEQVTTFFSNIKNLKKDVFGIYAFKNYFINNIMQLTIIFILGLSLIGIIAVVIFIFFKGFSLGLTIGTIIYKYSIKGVVATVLYIFPCVILNLFIFFTMSFFTLYVSKRFIVSFIKKGNLNFRTFLGKYLLSFLISIVLIVISSLLEAYMMPILLKLFTFII